MHTHHVKQQHVNQKKKTENYVTGVSVKQNAIKREKLIVVI